MKFIDPALEAFCESHSTPPSEVCSALSKYTQANVPMSVMLSGPLVGSFLGFLAHTLGARRVLEVGCYTGYSALSLAEHLPSDGEVITLDINPETAKVAQNFWDKSPHGKKIQLILGNAKETLGGLSGPFDLVFIDADKAGYTAYTLAALKLLSPNGVIVCDNCLYSGEVTGSNLEGNAKAIRKFDDWVSTQKDLYKTLVPIRDGLYLIRKLKA